MKMESPGKMIGVLETARLLGVSPPTVHALLRERRLPCLRFNRVVRMDFADVIAFRDRHTIDVEGQL